MNKFVAIFPISVFCTFLSSCSCAIYHESWQHKHKKPIPELTIQRASTELALQKPIYLGRTKDGLVTLHSRFCPTPYTLLSGGADVGAWNFKCNKAYSDVSNWFERNKIPLTKVTPHPNNAPVINLLTSH